MKNKAIIYSVLANIPNISFPFKSTSFVRKNGHSLTISKQTLIMLYEYIRIKNKNSTSSSYQKYYEQNNILPLII